MARWTDGLLKSTYHRVRAPRLTDNKVHMCTVPYGVTVLNFCSKATCFTSGLLMYAGATVFNSLLCKPQAEHYHPGKANAPTPLLLLASVMLCNTGYSGLA